MDASMLVGDKAPLGCFLYFSTVFLVVVEAFLVWSLLGGWCKLSGAWLF